MLLPIWFSQDMVNKNTPHDASSGRFFQLYICDFRGLSYEDVALKMGDRSISYLDSCKLTITIVSSLIRPIIPSHELRSIITALAETHRL
jgi:hypothetical protein